MHNLLIVGIVIIIGIGGFFLLQPEAEPVTDDTMVTENIDVEQTIADATQAAEESAAAADIVDTAAAFPELSTLVTAVTQAELVETLQGEGPFTVFAPTNEAFTALPAGTVDTLLLPENIADLQAVLTYHVVPGAVMSGDLTDGMVVETVNGESITINVSNTGVSINGSATVTSADIQTNNGVVHIIDSVLLPLTE